MKFFKKKEAGPGANAAPEIEREASELTPEMETHFNTLLAEASANHLYFKDNVSWEKFRENWEDIDNVFGKKNILEGRQAWFEMKKEGKVLVEYLTNRIRERLQNGESVYEYIRLCVSVVGTEDYNFFAEILGHETVWNNCDSSTAGRTLEYLADSGNPEATSFVVEYIKHILSDEYTRSEFRSSDLSRSVCTLATLSEEDETKKTLLKIAEESETFSGWLETHKILSGPFYTSSKPTEQYVTEEFNLEVEQARLAQLEKEFAEFAENPPEENPYEHSSIDGSPSFHTSPFVPLESERLESAEASVDLEASAKQWEEEKLINFFGRFKSKVEDPTSLTDENYPANLARAVGKIDSVDPEAYLDILDGVTEKTENDKEEERSVELNTPEQAYKVTAAGFARALSLGILENRLDEAITELDQIKDLLGRSAEQLDDSTQISFSVFLADQLGQLQSYLQTQKDYPLDTTLPRSAESFMMYHAGFDRAREIPDFRQLLAEKIRWYLAHDLANNIATIKLESRQLPPNVSGLTEERLIAIGGPSFHRLHEIVAEYAPKLELYKNVEKNDVPFYWEAHDALLTDLESKRNVVFGRDGRYFFTALKASDFGHGESENRYVVITRPMKEHYEHSEKYLVAQYLAQNGVALDFNFIDTGYAGTIPEFAIQCLSSATGVEMSAAEVDDRIKLLESKKNTRTQIIRKGYDREGSVGTVERRPHAYDSPTYLRVVGEGNRLEPEKKPKPVSAQLGAWVTEHVSLRNFAPRLDAEKRQDYLKSNPLEGYTFVQDMKGSGSVISTHPMELWEHEREGKKILVKGGPEHTLRADFVGSEIFNKLDVTAPKAELITIEDKLKLKMQYLEDYKPGGVELSEKNRSAHSIQKGLLIDALLSQYDRTPWNLMFREQGRWNDDVAFIDHGAGLTSRARGGHKGFSDNFTIQELEFILSNPQFEGKPVNAAYHNFIEVKDGQLVVHDKNLLRKILEPFKENLTDDYIDIIIGRAGYLRGEASVEDLQARIKELESQLGTMSPQARGYNMLKDAIETYRGAIEIGGESEYLKMALKKRRDGIVKMFETVLESD